MQTQLLEDFVDDGRAILGALQLQSVVLKMDEVVTDAISRLGKPAFVAQRIPSS